MVVINIKGIIVAITEEVTEVPRAARATLKELRDGKREREG
jgi:hypothetical protein